MSVEQIKQKYDATLRKLSEESGKKLKYQLLGGIASLVLFLSFIGLSVSIFFVQPILQVLFFVLDIFIIILFLKLKKFLEQKFSTLTSDDDMLKLYYDIEMEIIRDIDPSLNFYPSKYIQEEDFERSLLFRKIYDVYSGSGYTEGRIRAVNIKFSNIISGYKEEEVEYDNEGRARYKEIWVPVFEGIFVITDFNKKFENPILLYPKEYPNKHTNLDLLGLSYVKIEGVDFNKFYSVYAGDQIEAHYILSTSFIDRLLNYIAIIKAVPFLSFNSNMMYLGIPSRQLPIIPNFSPDAIENVYKSFSKIISLVEILNLDKVIWGTT